MTKRLTLIALAALMLVAVSCKKNAVQNANNEFQNPSVAIGQNPDIARIITFNKDVTARIENPMLKTCEVILNGVYIEKMEEPAMTEEYFDEYESWPYKYHADGDCEPTIDHIGADDTLQNVMRIRLGLNNNTIPAGYRAIVVKSKSYLFNGLIEPFWGLFMRVGEYASYTCIGGNGTM